MEITVYLDVFLFVNFSMDFFLLWLLKTIFRLKGNGFRLALGSAAGALFSAAALYGYLSGVLGFKEGPAAVLIWAVLVFGVSGLMVVLAFSLGSVKEFIQAEAGLLFGAVLTGGILEWAGTAWFFWRGEELRFSVLDMAAALLLLAGGSFLAHALWKLVWGSAGERSCCYQVTLIFKGRQATAQGFLDTGNRLKDPVSGRPVHVADRKLLESVCPAVDRISLIPYQTIDGGGALLKAVTLDRIEAAQGKHRLVYERPLVAASPGKLQMKNGCQILLHP